MSSIDGSGDYSSLMNSMKLNYANSIFGSASDVKVGALGGDVITQWNMLKANSAAYRKLLAAQESGTIKQDAHYSDLLSDKLFNDNYDAKNSKVTPATYSPAAASGATADPEATASDNLESMRRLALAAINGTSTLAATHYDLFESLRQTIANNLVAPGSGGENAAVVEDASAAVVSKNVGDFHLLADDQNFTVSGVNGEKNYSFSAGASLNAVVDAVNADSGETGVKASLVKNADGDYVIDFTSAETGEKSFVSITQNVGELFGGIGEESKAVGADAVAREAETVATGEQSIAAIAAGVFGGAMFGDQSFTVEGARGSREYAFASGVSVEDVAAAVNADSAETGVMAEVIYNAAGQAEGIGLMADKAGSGQYVKVAQNSGDLFADAGKYVKVSGSGTAGSGGGAIAALSDLGRVSIDGVVYSFADLAPGGAASLANNPDAALAVIDQALKDIYEGRAVINGFDPADQPLLSQPASRNTASTNTLEIGNFGSDAIAQWLSGYVKESGED